MSTVEKLLADCDRHIADLEACKKFIVQHEALLSKFGVYSSVGTGTMGKSFFLHDSPDNDTAKALCRAVGGDWRRENSNSGGKDYRLKEGNLDIVIFGAEPPIEAEKLVLS